MSVAGVNLRGVCAHLRRQRFAFWAVLEYFQKLLVVRLLRSSRVLPEMFSGAPYVLFNILWVFTVLTDPDQFNPTVSALYISCWFQRVQQASLRTRSYAPVSSGPAVAVYRGAIDASKPNEPILVLWECSYWCPFALNPVTYSVNPFF